MAILKSSIFVICLFFFISAWSYEAKDGNVTLSLGHYWFKTNFEDAGGRPSPPLQGGLGLIATGDLSNKGALELGFFQMSKRFYRRNSGYLIGEKTELIHITMGYRWWLNRYFSTSLSLFSSYSMGKSHIFYNDFPSGQTLKTSATDITEYGFDGTLTGEVWSRGRYFVFLEGRYSYSATAKVQESADHYGVFLGLRYFMQSKEKIKEQP